MGRNPAADNNEKGGAAVPVAGEVGKFCPHLVFDRVLGPQAVASLVDDVTAREALFKPATVRDRVVGGSEVDYSLRDCLRIQGAGPVHESLAQFISGISSQAVARLQLKESIGAPRDFEITGYRDGNRFGAHIDTDERLNMVRVMTCVYYFAATPRRFTGGELRIWSLPTFSSGRSGAPPCFVDVDPESDRLVIFPSWLRHEVLPVHVPSGAWADGRFTVTCWIPRANLPQ